MRKPVVFFIVIVILQSLYCLPVSAAASPGSLTAQSALLIEKDGGTILYEKDIYRRHPADSLTKIMTLLLASQAVESDTLSDNTIVEMTEEAWYDIDGDSATQSIQPGQMMTFIDLMYSAYIGNASEACNMIAIRVAGGVDAFVAKMNTKAAELGLDNTNFVNPHGQYHDNQYTTAYDMYVLYREALRSSLFAEIAGTYRHITEWTDETEPRTLVSTNSMLNQGSIYYYRYCLSGISSNTYEGGYSIIAHSEEEGLALISIILGASEVINDDESVDLLHFIETNRLFTWGYEKFGWCDIIKTTDLLARVPVMHGSGADFVNLRPQRSLTMLLDRSVTTESFDFNISVYNEEYDTPLIAPVTAGDELGMVVVSKDGIVYDTIPLIANTDIELSGMEYMRRQITNILSTSVARNIIIALVIIVVIYAGLVIRYNIMRINRLRRIRRAKEDLIREKHENLRN